MKINANGNPKQMRQGDVFMEYVAAIPTDAKPVARDNGRIVLAYGEVTGHAHAIMEQECEMFERDGTLYLRVGGEGATVRHEEHAAHVLQPGIVKVTRKREWTDADEPRQVAD